MRLLPDQVERCHPIRAELQSRGTVRWDNRVHTAAESHLRNAGAAKPQQGSAAAGKSMASTRARTTNAQLALPSIEAASRGTNSMVIR